MTVPEPATRFAAVAVAVTVTLALTGCVQFASSTRSLAVTEARTMLPYAESYFEAVLADFVDRDSALAAIRAGETGFGTALLTAETRDDVLRSDFNRTGVALYATGADNDQLYADVLVSARGVTSDWTGEDAEIVYLCVRQLGTPSQPRSASIEQATCPDDLIDITLPGTPATVVTLAEMRSE
ncbi:hypothetical protein E3T55_15150 [Cryobacterium frigoriphilum]|uniref:Uncharacterized protein n=1 Tax=Cryobacterium frigoriphilum TaxID=1259150 RepID=A0A4R8ZWN7_9MICO|nr:hypothetical protein [Cryobacterium frigoriphilum]TFD47881.1 hypothetical protein E3T55_15150 [Cryobacterium frigoriphilum]